MLIKKQPALIIVTGRPAAGKSTLAKWLSEELSIPVVSKDRIREVLFDSLGWKDRERAQLFGKTSIDLMFYFARVEFTTGNSIIMDNAFHPPVTTPRVRALIDEFDLRCIQIVCDSDRETLFKRFKTRAEAEDRHPGHGDKDVFDELYKNLAFDYSRTLDVGGLVLEVDTTDFEKVDHQGILARTKRYFQSGAVDNETGEYYAIS